MTPAFITPRYTATPVNERDQALSWRQLETVRYTHIFTKIALDTLKITNKIHLGEFCCANNSEIALNCKLRNVPQLVMHALHVYVALCVWFV